MKQKISSRGREVPELIRDRVPFDTYGAMSATRESSPWQHWSGCLSGYDLDVWMRDLKSIRYIVWSYSTPIAWWTADGHWHVVRQRFSVTTSKHQSRLYLIPGDHWSPWFDASLRSDLTCKRQRGQHAGPVGYTDDGTLCGRHYLMRPAVKRMMEAVS